MGFAVDNQGFAISISSKGSLSASERAEGEAAIATALGAVLADPALEDAMRGELMLLPTQSYLFEQLDKADPAAIHREREGLKALLGSQLADGLHALYERAAQVPYDGEGARGARKVKTQALAYLAASDSATAARLAAAQYDAADNMTDRQGALMVLTGLDTPVREEKLADFYRRYQGNALVIDKWFMLQALSLHPRVLEHVKVLKDHPDFTIRNPNRVRSLYMGFAANPPAFHTPSGEGYRIVADLILALDPINPQAAARFVPALGRWRRLEDGRAALMRAELERIAAAEHLSRDTYEQVSRSLDG